MNKDEFNDAYRKLPALDAPEYNREDYATLILDQAKIMANKLPYPTLTSQDREDITQDSATKLMGALDRIESNGNPNNYLARTVKNAAIDVLRRKRSRNPVSLEAMTENTHWTPISSEAAPIDGIIQQEEEEILNQALSNLSTSHEEALRLRLDGEKYEDIAAQMDTPVGTVKSRLNTATTSVTETIRKGLDKDNFVSRTTPSDQPNERFK